MNLMQFNKEELIQIESLLQSATDISKIYDRLCELEINNEKESQEYKELIAKLNKAIKEENKKYDDFISSYHQCIKYATLLASKTKFHIFDDQISTTARNYDNRVIRRIIMKLTNIAKSNPNFNKHTIPDEIINTLTKLSPNITKSDFHTSLNHNRNINQSLKNDIQSIFLSILEEAISYKTNTRIRNQLIKAKYCIIFAHKNLESMMIKYNFNMPSNVYIYSKIMNEVLTKDSLSYDIMKYFELKSQASKEINYLLAIRDPEYDNSETNIDSIISQYYLRALISLMTGEEVDRFNEEFHNEIESEKYLQAHPTDRISENAIMKCFKLFKQDKGRIRTLSTKSDN